MVRGQRSAGVLLFRRQPDGLRVLLGHPGGPFWRNKHTGAWSIPKGLVESGEDERAAALREFSEETGSKLDGKDMVALGETTLRSGKTVMAWAVEGDLDVASLASNPVRLEWPRGSGTIVEFPEIDKIRWCALDEARILLNSGQVTFLDRLQDQLNHAP
jgi:predicted NUDIX family NTP pyrophosphohydrolase